MVWLLSLAFAVAPFPCGSLDQAHMLAQQGRLFPHQRVCLEDLAKQPGDYRLTASHLLMNDATMRGSHATWQRLAERHLTTIDGDDPALVVAYARFLFVGDRNDETITFIDQVLPRTEGWGPEGVEPGLALHRMRTVAAVNSWRDTAQHVDRAHQYAAAWAQAAEAAGRTDGTAHSLCTMTGPAGDCPLPTVADAD